MSAITPFKADDYLEVNPETKAIHCLHTFLTRGGIFQSIPRLPAPSDTQITLQPGDAVYPICSGGWCRSQTLWVILQSLVPQIILFPPHAARVGWDPYNGQINRYRNYVPETMPDAFEDYFKMAKCTRFGFEHAAEWKAIEQCPTQEGLQEITAFYDYHYFGPESAWQGQKGLRRVYIAFSHNTHVVLHRLLQTNDNLEGVVVIGIEADDIITYPPPSLEIASRSVEAYAYFTALLRQPFQRQGH